MIKYPKDEIHLEEDDHVIHGDKKPQENDLTDLKCFDMYHHLQNNVVRFEKNCKDSIANPDTIAFYCIQCGVSICNMCGYEAHKSHFLINKSDYYKMEEDLIKKTFDNIDGDTHPESEFSRVQELKDQLNSLITTKIDSLHTKLDEIKEEKVKEMTSMFSSSEGNLDVLRKNIDTTKANILQFFEKNKKFFSLFQNNNDQENTIFLVLFELMNICTQKNHDITDIINKIKNDSMDYQHEIETKTDNLMNSMNEFLCESHQEEDIPINKQFKQAYDKLSDDFYKDIRQRIKKYNEHINSFKQIVYDTVKKDGSLEEISKINELFDSKNKHGIEYIFSNEMPGQEEIPIPSSPQKAKGSVRVSISSEAAARMSNSNIANLFNPLLELKSKEDVLLDHKIIQRYFAYSTLDTVNKNFRVKPKTSVGEISSGSLIPRDHDEDEDMEVAKPIIGTNEIQIYERRTRSLIKKKVPLEKQEHGLTVFLDGTRHILIKDKLYITGGKDSEKKDTQICLAYNIKDFTIKRLPDMKFPRAYHSLEYLEIYKSMLVIGGENNPTCELYDLFTNRWRRMPELNFPRANISLYFDRISSQVYSIFGIKGDITSSEYSDMIEVLELKEMGNGWGKIEYHNKTDMDFRLNFCSVFPVTKDKLLIYGANKSRFKTKSFAVFLVNKYEMVKVDSKLMDEIRTQARKSVKLSKIISTANK